jgi:hypothetical protein
VGEVKLDRDGLKKSKRKDTEYMKEHTITLTDDTKLNCAGEFMMACDDPYQMSQVVGALSALADINSLNGGCTTLGFLEEFSNALNYCIEQAKEERAKSSSENPELADDFLCEILEFAHTYLAKAYEKKVGRAVTASMTSNGWEVVA